MTAAWSDHHEEVYAFLVHTTRSPEVAEDLLQEAFLRLMREAHFAGATMRAAAWTSRDGLVWTQVPRADALDAGGVGRR